MHVLMRYKRILVGPIDILETIKIGFLGEWPDNLNGDGAVGGRWVNALLSGKVRRGLVNHLSFAFRNCYPSILIFQITDKHVQHPKAL
jgi:hypothetical protein